MGSFRTRVTSVSASEYHLDLKPELSEVSSGFWVHTSQFRSNVVSNMWPHVSSLNPDFFSFFLCEFTFVSQISNKTEQNE